MDSNFLSELQKVDSSNISSIVSIHDQLHSFVTLVNKIVSKKFPLKVKSVGANRLSKPWLTSGILRSVKTKSCNFKII